MTRSLLNSLNSVSRSTQDNVSGTPKYETLPTISHASRAASASNSANAYGTIAGHGHHHSNSTSNPDSIFVPPKTPVRSKTRDSQYTTPSKMISKSDSMKVKVTPSKSMDSDLNIFSPSTPVTRK